MSSTGETTDGQGQSLRLLSTRAPWSSTDRRRRGPQLARSEVSISEPGSSAPRRSGIARSWNTSARHKQPYTDTARAYEPSPLAAPGRQGGVSPPDRGAESLVGGRRPGRRRLADRDRQNAPRQHGHRAGRPAHAGHHPHHRPDEPVVRRAHPQLRRRRRSARRRLLRHSAADRDNL